MSKSYSFSTFFYQDPYFNTVQALIDPEAVDCFVESNVVVPLALKSVGKNNTLVSHLFWASLFSFLFHLCHDNC